MSTVVAPWVALLEASTGWRVAVAGLLGLAIGSFLNVVIYRLPEGRSVVAPGSRCNRCDARVAWYDNVPVLSYLVLRGRCRHCAIRLSPRYPLVEALTGGLAVAIALRAGASFEAVVLFAFAAALVVITFVDLDWFIIPDAISYPGIVLAFACSALPWTERAMGFAVGFGGLWFVALAYWLVRHREGLGGGDVKLMGMVGALLGPQAALFTVLVAAIVGTVVGIAAMLARGASLKLAIPFGPFLAFGALAWVLGGDAWWLAHSAAAFAAGGQAAAWPAPLP